MSSDKQERDKEIDMKKQITVLTCCTMLFALCLPAPGAAAEENRANRVSIVVVRSAMSPHVLRQFGWLCASWAISKDRTSLTSTDTEGKRDRLSEVAAELVRLKVDISW